MTEPELLALLNSIDFPHLYWEFCDRFPLQPALTSSSRKEDIVAAFKEMGVLPKYDSRDRSFVCEEEKIGDWVWSGVFCKQRCGLELLIVGKSLDARCGSNFASLAYEAKRLADPTFERSPFFGPPPYPRPDHAGDPDVLKEIVKELVALVRLIKDKIRSRNID
jgi:hypothetical protein